MTETHEQDWSNYWQGRASDQALVGVGIEGDAQLAAFWAKHFETLPKSTRLLDMACGAGSVLKHADGLGFTDLTGVDISPAAIDTLAKTLPNVKGVIAPAIKTKLDSGSFDMTVSQFGFEYAGDDKQVLAAAGEMARLLGASGVFTALCHIKGGGIEQEVSGHLRGIEQITQTGFTAAARSVFKCAFAAEQAPSASTKKAYDAAVAGLLAPNKTLADFTARQSGTAMGSLAQHLSSGTAEMFTRRAAYSISDILDWLDGMDAQINAYAGRMQSMKSAALSEEMAQSILSVLQERGLKAEPLEKLYLGDDPKPAAWALIAKR